MLAGGTGERKPNVGCMVMESRALRIDDCRLTIAVILSAAKNPQSSILNPMHRSVGIPLLAVGAAIAAGADASILCPSSAEIIVGATAAEGLGE